jgi:hypothetical protein
MREILPGVHHWSTFHEPIGGDVSSYLLSGALCDGGALAVDPKLPDGSFDAFPVRPTAVVLSTGLHNRDAALLAADLGIPVRATREAAQRLAGRLEIETFDHGAQLGPGVRHVQIGALCPDEGALFIEAGAGAIMFADALTRTGTTLEFVPDSLMGEDPDAVRRGLLSALCELLEFDFDNLLFAHGDPLLGGGRAALTDFVSRA